MPEFSSIKLEPKIIAPEFRVPGFQPPGGALSVKSFKGAIQAKLASIDQAGLFLIFGTRTLFRAPSKCERAGGSKWSEAGVAQADPQFLEYQQTNPEVRTYHFMASAYNLHGGIANHLEDVIYILKLMSGRVPGKPYGHRLMYTQGIQRFRCVLEDWTIPVELVNAAGGAMEAYDCSMKLKEIRR